VLTLDEETPVEGNERQKKGAGKTPNRRKLPGRQKQYGAIHPEVGARSWGKKGRRRKQGGGGGLIDGRLLFSWLENLGAKGLDQLQVLIEVEREKSREGKRGGGRRPEQVLEGVLGSKKIHHATGERQGGARGKKGVKSKETWSNLGWDLVSSK